MERPFLVLWFALALFAVLGAWGIYHLVTSDESPPSPPAHVAPATQPLVERLREERERRIQERDSTTAPSSSPGTRPVPSPGAPAEGQGEGSASEI